MSLKNRTAPITLSDVGIPILIELGEDVSSFSTYQLRLKDPSGATKEVVCTLNPDSNTSMILTLTATTFDSAGKWLAQAKLSSGANVTFGDQFEIEVVAIIN